MSAAESHDYSIADALTRAQRHTLMLWHDHSRSQSAKEYALHEGDLLEAGITESPRGARIITNALVNRGLAIVESWDDGNLLRLTPDGLRVLDVLFWDTHDPEWAAEARAAAASRADGDEG